MTAALHVTVGIPGCGKSTWAANIARAYPERSPVIISSDEIRKEITGDMTNQTRNKEVFWLVNQRTIQALDNGSLVIVDATNLKPSNRKQYLDIADELEVVAYAARFSISVNFSECQERNLGRDRVVPEDVMQRFWRDFRDNCSMDQLLKEGWAGYDV